MGFLSGLFHSRDKPTNSTNGSAYRFLFGGSNSGKAVNERSAIQMTAVYACGRILSESIAGLPIHVYKYTDSGSKEKVIKHPLYRLIHDEPNPEMTSFVLRETLIKGVSPKTPEFQIKIKYYGSKSGLCYTLGYKSAFRLQIGLQNFFSIFPVLQIGLQPVFMPLGSSCSQKKKSLQAIGL